MPGGAQTHTFTRPPPPPPPKAMEDVDLTDTQITVMFSRQMLSAMHIWERCDDKEC